jgi:hypothetical protein
MPHQFFPRTYGGVGKKHQGLKVPPIKDHVGYPFAMSLIPGSLDLRVIQISYDHEETPFLVRSKKQGVRRKEQS